MMFRVRSKGSIFAARPPSPCCRVCGPRRVWQSILPLAGHHLSCCGTPRSQVGLGGRITGPRLQDRHEVGLISGQEGRDWVVVLILRTSVRPVVRRTGVLSVSTTSEAAEKTSGVW